jgi:uncharacterized membrane protein
MTILHVPPESPFWISAGADTILFLHIAGGSLAIASGAVTLLSRKGERVHRVAGTVFFASMLMATMIAVVVSPFLTDGQRPNFVAAVLALYLIVTGWATVKRKEGRIGRLEVSGFVVALSVATAGLLFMLEARNSPTGTIDGSPPQSFYVFMFFGGIAAASDLKVIVRGGIAGAPRIARHLWRMCTALFIAAGSFFLGQQQVMPAYMRGSSLLFVPELAVIGLMIFWLMRVRFTHWLKPAALAS